MALIACPGCSLPRTAGDAAHPCPVCGYTPAPAVIAPPADDEDASALTLGPDIEPVTAPPTPGPAIRPPAPPTGPLHLAPSPSALHRLPPGPVSAQVYIATAPPTAKIRSPKAAPAPPSAPVPLVAAPPSAVVPSVPVSAPASSPGPWLLPWILAGIGFGGTLVCATGWYLASADAPLLVEQPPPRPAPPAAVVSREVAPTPRRVSVPAPVGPEAAPMPRPAAVAPPPARVGEFAVLRIDQPNDIYKLDVVGAGNRLKLVGRAAKLSIDGVTGGAMIDATELTTKAVTLVGPIDGGAAVALKVADGGTIHVRGVVGGSTLVVDAPGGTVSFEKQRGGTAAVAAARVTVTARSVVFAAPVSGTDTRVEVTLTARGALRFVELSDAAKLVYRQARPDDPLPTVSPGKILDTAECRRVD